MRHKGSCDSQPVR